jgi:membrane protease YdiL (CAAX protease family)
MTPGNEGWAERRPHTLSKLMYVLSAATILYTVSVRIVVGRLLGPMRRLNIGGAVATSQRAYPATLLISLFIMTAVVIAYRPLGGILRWSRLPEGGAVRILRSVAYGLAGGLACYLAAAAAAWLWRGAAPTLPSSTIAEVYGSSPWGVVTLLLLGVALPIASEMVFRGVVLETLMQCASLPAAILASAVLFAYW